MMVSSDISLLVTASSSDHMIKVWDVSRLETGSVECVAEVDTTCRVTSLATWHPGMKGSGKKKRKVVEEVIESLSKKKVRVIEDDSPEKTVTETITVEEEENDTSVAKSKTKKKKKKSIEVS